MRSRSLSLVAGVLSAGLAAAVPAGPVRAEAGDASGEALDPVARGAYLRGELGALVVPRAPVAGDADRPVLSGPATGLAAGADLGDAFQVEAFGSVVQVRAPIDYVGLEGGGGAGGDFSLLLAGARARWAAVTVTDRAGVARLGLGVQGGGGLLWTRPGAVLGGRGPVVVAGPMAVYRPRLRRFSVFLSMDVLWAPSPGVVAPQPSLSVGYTF